MFKILNYNKIYDFGVNCVKKYMWYRILKIYVYNYYDDC